MLRIASGTVDQFVYFNAGQVGLSSFTVYRSRNGAAAAVMTTPTINETDSTNMPGVYELLMDEDMTIGASNVTEHMAFWISHGSMAPVFTEIELFDETAFGGGGGGDATEAKQDTIIALIGTPAADVSADIAAVKVDSAAILVDTAVIGAAGAGLTEAGGTGDHLTALATAAALATVDTEVGVIDGIVDSIVVDTGTTIPGLLTTIDSEIGVIDGNVDTILVDTGTTLDAKIANLESGIIMGAAVTGTLTTTVATTNLTGYGNDQLNGRVIIWLSGDADGEASPITDYASTNGTITFDALTIAPGNGSLFKII